MLTLLLSWISTAVITGAFGRATWDIGRRLGVPGTEARLALEWRCLLGLGVLAPVVGGISLGWALSTSVQMLLAVSALALLLLQRQAYLADLRHAWTHVTNPRNRWRLLAGLLLVSVLGSRLLYQSALPPANFDSGLYHYQSLRWLNEYPTVPGLGNLHGRLAFNSSWFVLLSAFRFDAPTGPVYGLGGFLGALLMLAVVRATVGEARSHRSGWALPLLYFLLLWSFQIWLSSPTPDYVLPVLLIFAFLRYARKWEQGHGRRFDADTVLVGLLLLLAVTSKLSVLPALLLPLHSVWASRRAMSGRNWGLIIALVLVVLTPWLLRGVLLSGYLLYPVAALDWVSVDWKIPLAAVRMEQYMITNVGQWTLQPTCLPPRQTLAQWVPHWWGAQGTFVRGVMLAAASSFVPAAIRWRRLPLAEVGWFMGWLTAWLGGIFWFWTAPDYRFAVGFLLVAGVWPYLGLLPPEPRYARAARWLPFVLTLAWGLHSLRDILYQLRTQPDALAQRLVWPAGPPTAPMLLIQPAPGPRVRVPQVGIQCWNAPLPCAVCPEIALEMRGATLTQGFRPPRIRTGRVCCLAPPNE